MSMYSHRGMGAVPPGNSARLNELLDQIRAEFETQLRQAEGFEHQSMWIISLALFPTQSPRLLPANNAMRSNSFSPS